ncbi:MAG: hypothetical protein ABEN55_18680, partial [Bradymonadaceae bacterium]
MCLYRGLPNVRCFLQVLFNLGQFDTNSAKLKLIVFPSSIFELAVGIPCPEIAGAKQSGSSLSGIRIRDKGLCSRS